MIGTSLSKPYNDRDNSHVCMYVCMYVLCIHVSNIFTHTPVPEIHVRPEMLHVFRYIDVLMCMIYN